MSKENDAEFENEVGLLQWARETQRNIDFIVRQQAQFSADLQRLREMQDRAEQRWGQADERWEKADERWEKAEGRWERIERMWERTEGSVRSLHAIAQIHEGEIKTLAEAQSRTDAQMAETDERLNALINILERIISERRNGGGQREEGSG